MAGVESAALSTGSSTISNGVSYGVQVKAQGTDYHKVYIRTGNTVAERNSYTVNDTHQQNATGTKLTLGTITTVDIDVFPGDGVTFSGVD